MMQSNMTFHDKQMQKQTRSYNQSPIEIGDYNSAVVTKAKLPNLGGLSKDNNF